ncbi:hypothetical protein D7M15_16285 [Streptomyces sp. Z26]|nr:hypothetical protein D7M15_16285 [Streptomyces sp. Z26]
MWHVMWDAQLDNSVTCAEHMQLIQERWVYADRHPMTADCTMPGALWVYVNDKCYVPQTDLAAYERVITEAVHDMAEQAGIPLHLLDR